MKYILNMRKKKFYQVAPNGELESIPYPHKKRIDLYNVRPTRKLNLMTSRAIDICDINIGSSIYREVRVMETQMKHPDINYLVTKHNISLI